MRKVYIFGLMIVMFTLGSMSLMGIDSNSSKSLFTLGSRNSEYLVINFRVPQFEITHQEINGIVYQKVKIDDAEYFTTPGEPELPFFSTMVAIPIRGHYSCETLTSIVRVVNQFIPIPAQNNVRYENSSGYDLCKAIYSSSQTYPSESIICSSPQVVRDFRVVSIQVQPFAWDSATNQLMIKEEMEIKLTFNAKPSINELITSPLITSTWVSLYESMILNFDDYRPVIVENTPPKILIIHGNYTDTTFLNKISAFAFWKKQKGAIVNVISTGTTGSTNSSIKSYIQDLYNVTNTRPDFIILIGDVTGTFPVPTWIENQSGFSGGGDYPYQQLAGNDALGDCFLGRISAENTSELDIIISKITSYEKNIDIATSQWLNRILLVGDTMPSGQSTIYTCKYIKELALNFNPDFTFYELYSGDPSPTMVDTAINLGVGIFNYRGISGMSGWSPSQNLINGIKLPHAVIITCSTGDFWNGTSTAETFIRLGTVSVPRGAVTAIGMSTAETHTMFNNCLSGGIFDGLFTHQMRTMGEALLNGKLYLYEIYGTSHSTQSQYFAHWCNLMGDPTMEVFCSIPRSFSINELDIVPIGSSNLDLSIHDDEVNPVLNACVTISQNNNILARAYSDEAGHVYLPFVGNLTTGLAYITISKHNFKPLQQTIEVDASGSLVTDEPVIDDDNNGYSIGNGNNQPNSGERLEVLFAVKNTTNIMLSNVSGFVTTIDQYVTVIDSLISFGSIASGSTGTSLISSLIEISERCPNNTLIRLDLNLIDSNSTHYILHVFIQVSDAFMEYISYQIIDINNQVLDPSESVNLNLTIINSGSESVNNLHGKLYTLNDLVAIDDDYGYFGNLLAGAQSSTTNDNFIIRGRDSLLPGMIIRMRLKLFTSNGFIQWVDFDLPVGLITITSPLGSDAYGYVIYDDGDVLYADCPTFQWVGIAPAEGGNGTALIISDPDAPGEGDGVGAQSVAYVDLPFSFQFFGLDYMQISVCSNGFIVMGFTANAEFRNYRLPGAMGPAPMIAPFWDDLATGTGSGIYTWYDTANHRFIVEWYHMLNGYQNSMQETFQVILHDPAFYPTSLGDGPIKIQYYTFNNVDSGTSDLNHGNYCTIGIENCNQQIGLEYSYNNTYPTAARPLANGRCFYITNAPSYNALPDIAIGQNQITDPNGNSVVEPGELIQANVQLVNSGETDADNTFGMLSTTDPYVMITNADVQYPSIPDGGSAYALTPFSFNVSSQCPGNHEINFVLNIIDGTYTEQLTFTMTVEKPELSLASFYLNDISVNNNGIADPNEDFLLVLNVTNLSPSDAQNISGTLTTTQPNVTINNPTQNIPWLHLNDKVQFVFPIHFGALTTGTSVPFSLAYTADNSVPGALTLNVLCGSGPANQTGVINGTVSMSNGVNSSPVLLTTDNHFLTHPSADGSYALYFPVGTYTLAAALQYYYNTPLAPVTISVANLTHLVNINMAFLANPTGLNITGNQGETQATLTWVAPENPVYPVINYKVYRTFDNGEFAILAEPINATFIDDLAGLEDGTYTYYVSAVYTMGEGAPGEQHNIAFPFVGIGDEPVPTMVNALYSNYPNPFNPTTSLAFSLAKASNVSLRIYNTKGQIIKTIVDDYKSAGLHKVIWNGDDNAGKPVSSGMYLYKIEAGSFSSTRKMMMLK